MDREELILIALANTKGIGRRRLHRILADGMRVEELLDAAEKGDSAYWGEPALSSLRETYSGNAGKMAEQCVGEGKRIAFMCEQKNIKIVTAMNDDYPARLRGITDAPILLYVKGKLPREDKPAVAIIGARACSAYGKAVAHSFAGELAVRGVQIISGMARGIDGIGQESAVNAGGETFAVLGNGVDVCYPKEHRGLYDAILTRGGLISEYFPGTEPQPAYFPERNRIISGLSDLVLVVEARKRSGTYITVTQALEQGREVYAVPGRVTDALSDGCNVLIKDGAGIADSVSGIMEALAGIGCHKIDTGERDAEADCRCVLKNGGARPEDGLQEILFGIIDLTPRNWNEIYRLLNERIEGGITLPEFSATLVRMELAGLIESTGNYYVKKYDI